MRLPMPMGLAQYGLIDQLAQQTPELRLRQDCLLVLQLHLLLPWAA
jgi:hypothetical protein